MEKCAKVELPNNIFSMDGWCTKEKAKFLYNVIAFTKSKLTVELGVFAGRSFIPMALAHKDLGSGRCVAIDTWSVEASTQNYVESDVNYGWWKNIDHEKFYNMFCDALKNYKVDDICDVVRSDSCIAAFQFQDASIDVLHQDSNHSEQVSCSEVLLYAPKIKPGGWWIMDDTNWDSTQKAQELLLTKGFGLMHDFTTWKVYKKCQ